VSPPTRSLDARVPALDSAMADASAPREGVAYGVTLGSTFAGDARPGEAYAAFKYDWRAPAIDPAKPAVVRREGGDGDAGAVTVEFQSVVEGERPINYRGTYVGAKRDVPSSSARDVGVECALVFDAATGAFTVEKIGGAVKSLRVSRDARGDDAGVGVGVNEDANKTARRRRRSRGSRTRRRLRRWNKPRRRSRRRPRRGAPRRRRQRRRRTVRAVRLRERGVGPGVGVGVERE